MTSIATESLFQAIADAVEAGLAAAETTLPDDVVNAIRSAAANETNPVARNELQNIIRNIETAEKDEVPVCQDTGVPVIYMTVPPEIPYTPEIEEAVAEGVRRATASVPLRPNVVHPITRENTGDNTGLSWPVIHVRPGKRLSVTVFPKGAGSENMSRMAMFLPSQTDEIKKYVVETVLIAGGRPCPPVIVGVGLGGTFDGAPALAKEALLERIDEMDEYEQEICDEINKLGIGPMGLGGDTTALAVKVKTAGCHTASLPVAVNIQCWASRHVTVYPEVPDGS
jgi:fumarate hydratase subunit alpha